MKEDLTSRLYAMYRANQINRATRRTLADRRRIATLWAYIVAGAIIAGCLIARLWIGGTGWVW